jgi:hypothetical protein
LSEIRKYARRNRPDFSYLQPQCSSESPMPPKNHRPNYQTLENATFSSFPFYSPFLPLFRFSLRFSKSHRLHPL